MPPEPRVLTKRRTRRSDEPTTDATRADGPLGQLISMTEWALPPAVTSDVPDERRSIGL